MTYKPTKVEKEIQRRIKLSLAAYLYEILDVPSTMSDAEWDSLALKINPSLSTGHAVMDKFFREEFWPHSGMWIHKHPELDKLDTLYKRLTMGNII